MEQTYRQKEPPDLPKQRSSKNADFIVSADIDNRLNLLPYADFLKKYSSYSKEEKLLLLFEFEELYETGMISPEYLSKEWIKIDFGQFVNSRIKTIEGTNASKDRLNFTVQIKREFTNTVNSKNSIEEKIIVLSRLKDHYVQYYGIKKFKNDVLFIEISNKLKLYKEQQKQQKIITGNLDYEQIKNVALSLNKAYERLQEQTLGTSSEPEPPGAGENAEPVNPHFHYFINGYHWQLFNEWRQQLYKPDDFSFIYRVMWDDGFIYPEIGQKAFKTWIESTFSTGNLGKQLKTLENCDSKAKYTIYQEKINKYQLHSKTLQKRSANTTKM